MSDKKKARRQILESISRSPSESQNMLDEQKRKEKERKERLKENVSRLSDRIRDYDERIKSASSDAERDKLIAKKKKLEKIAHSDPAMKEKGFESDKFYDVSKYKRK